MLLNRHTIILTAITAFSAVIASDGYAAEASVGIPADEITVAVESITVQERSVTPVSYGDCKRIAFTSASEEERLNAVACIVEQDELVKVIRNDSSSKVRMAAFGRLADADLIFRMIFKPGLKSVNDVRPAAVSRIPEVEVVKFIAAKCHDAQAAESAKLRLSELFADEADRQFTKPHSSIVDMAKRTARL